MSGKLLLIGTPIGNLDDLSPRASASIRACSLLLCEDTRHTRKLLTHFGISVPVESFHEHNEDAKADRMLDRVEGGETIGLVSDAGLPLLSDPGFPIVRRARERRIRLEAVPGPFAGALALIASGIAPVPFAFFGFPPHRAGERETFYGKIAAAGMTSIVYEAPHRIVASLRAARETLGNVEATVARELTKRYEELIHGTLDEVIADLDARETIRGELTIILAAPRSPERPELAPSLLKSELQTLQEAGLKRSEALKILAEKYGRRKNEIYRLLLEES